MNREAWEPVKVEITFRDLPIELINTLTGDDHMAICECGHAGALHDIETMTAQLPRCCVDGCGCGSGG